MTRRDLCESTQYAESLSFFLQGAHSPRGAAGHALHRCAGLLKGGKRAGGEKPAPGFDRAALSATTAAEPQTRAAHQRNAARAPGTTGRRAGPGFAAGHAQGTPRAGNVLPPGPRIRLYQTNRRIDESTKNRRLLSDGLESLGQGPCPKGSRSGSRRFGKVGKSSRPPESGNSRSPSSTRWNTSSASLAHRLSGFIWCRVFTALFPPGSRAFGDEPRPNDCRTNDCRTNDSFFLARESLSVSVFNLFFVVVAFSLFFPCFPRAPSSWRGFPALGPPRRGKAAPAGSSRSRERDPGLAPPFFSSGLATGEPRTSRPGRRARPGEGGGECSSPTLSRRDGPRPGPFSGPDGGHVTSRP